MVQVGKSTTRSVGVRTVRCGPRFSKPSFNEGNSIEHYRKCSIFIIFWPFPIRNYFIVAFPKLVRKTVISISKKRETLSLLIICAQRVTSMDHGCSDRRSVIDPVQTIRQLPEISFNCFRNETPPATLKYSLSTNCSLTWICKLMRVGLIENDLTF